jgi:hypothetical protein
MGKKKIRTEFSVGKTEGERQLGRYGLGWVIILLWNVET